MRATRGVWLAVFLGAVAGAYLSHLSLPTWASRNSSGTYSLPAGNPVVSGTTITSSNENAFRADVTTELTASLDRSGRGAMLAPLQCSNGTVAAPSLTFGSDTDTGAYRVSANVGGLTANGVNTLQWSATGVTFPLLSSATGILSTTNGLTATQSTTNGSAVTATGNGAGHGVIGTGGPTGHGFYGTGGASGGSGVIGIGGATNGSGGVFLGGASNGPGITSTGDGTAQGGSFVGGDTSGTGVIGTGGAPNGIGGDFTGTGTGVAVQVGTGHAKFTGAVASSATGFTNTQTPMNLIKAWGQISNSGSTYTVNAGFNISGTVSCSGNTVTVTMTNGMSTSAPQAIIVNGSSASGSAGSAIFHGTRASDTTFTISAVAFGGVDFGTVNLCTSSDVIYFLVLGAQ